MIDLKIILALGLIGFSVVEVGVTAATPIWVTLAIFAVNHLIEMHARGAAPQSALSAAPA